MRSGVFACRAKGWSRSDATTGCRVCTRMLPDASEAQKAKVVRKGGVDHEAETRNGKSRRNAEGAEGALSRGSRSRFAVAVAVHSGRTRIATDPTAQRDALFSCLRTPPAPSPPAPPVPCAGRPATTVVRWPAAGSSRVTYCSACIARYRCRSERECSPEGPSPIWIQRHGSPQEGFNPPYIRRPPAVLLTLP